MVTELLQARTIYACIERKFAIYIYWTGLTLLNGFSFLVNFFFFFFWVVR